MSRGRSHFMRYLLGRRKRMTDLARVLYELQMSSTLELAGKSQAADLKERIRLARLAVKDMQRAQERTECLNRERRERLIRAVGVARDSGMSFRAIGDATGFSADWVSELADRYHKRSVG